MNDLEQLAPQLNKVGRPQKRKPAMAALTPKECLARLHVIYRDAHKFYEAQDHDVMAWADQPEPWATHQIAYRNWSYYAAEAVVRQCRVLRKRAHAAAGKRVTKEGI